MMFYVYKEMFEDLVFLHDSFSTRDVNVPSLICLFVSLEFKNMFEIMVVQ